MSDHRAGSGWGRGADGQRATAAALSALPATCHFFHGLPIGRGGDEVDHLIIGPTGVWVVNSSHWTGRVTVTPDGMLWRDHTAITAEIEAMQERAAYARRTVGSEVRAVLCVVGPSLPEPHHRIAGVDVVGVDWLVALITAQATSLDRDQIDGYVRAAAEWRVHPPDHRHPLRPTPAVAAARRPDTAAPASGRTPGRRVGSRRRHRSVETGAMALATTVALSALAIIGYVAVRDDDPGGLGRSIDSVDVSAGASPEANGTVRIEVRCPEPGKGYELVGRIGALARGTVRMSAVVDGKGSYLGEFRALDSTGPVGGIDAATTTRFDVQTVDAAGQGGPVTHLDVTTPDVAC